MPKCTRKRESSQQFSLNKSWLYVTAACMSLVVGSCEVTTEACCPARRKSNQCTLYVANSTIPNAGVGIFTADHLSPGDVVGYGDILMPLIDLYWHHPDEFERGNYPFKDYVWQGAGSIALETVDHYHRAKMMGYGLEAAVNCHLALVNTHFASYEIDSELLHRAKDPGAGAFSPYLNGKTLVAYDIPAGGELFKMYGDDWFTTRWEEFGILPLTNDYPQADILIQKFGFLFPEAQTQSALTDLQSDLWNLMTNFPYPSRTLSALPKDLKHVPLVLREGIWSSYMLEATRPVDEIKKSGRCMDNISHGPSTLLQAGRGAFATRSFPEGAILTGSPLIHIRNLDSLAMYQDVYDDLAAEDGSKRDEDEDHSRTLDPQNRQIRTYQIALNYCWKHRDSTLLLCPYGAGVNFINHNRSLANIKVQWAPSGVIGHDDAYLRKNLTALFETQKPRLAFDFVALRDIEEGEELFLDYGPEWEAAYAEHVLEFESKKKSSDQAYQPASEWNLKQSHSTLRTEKEQIQEPYPSNLQIRCHPLLSSTTSLLEVIPSHLQDYSWSFKDAGSKCQILGRTKEVGTQVGKDKGRHRYVYRVRIDEGYKINYDLPRGHPLNSMGQCIELDAVPRSSIRFFDIPYTSDIHLEGAFRHPIGIPDEIFPSAWKNQ